MKYIILSLFFLSLSATSQILAQGNANVFGEVPVSAFDMQVYEKDPEAGAVILFDIGHSRFIEDGTGGFKIHFTRTTRIRILRDAAIDQVSDVLIPYYTGDDGSSEHLLSLQAFTYNLQNGIVTKVPVNVTEIYEERVNDYWKLKKFTFPRVKEGSVIEYRYELESPFLLNLTDWEFQAKVPTIYSSYSVSMIPFYEYMFILQGAGRFSSQTAAESGFKRNFGGVEFKDLVHTCVMRDVPAFRDEGFITSREHYIIKMDFQLSRIKYPSGSTKEIITTWPKLITSLLEQAQFGRFITRSKKQAEIILTQELNLQQIPEADRIKAIVGYVKGNYRWNGYSRYSTSTEPKDFVVSKNGNSADINLFLCALLQTAGIQAHPVLISTRDHGKIKADYPFEHFFNYVLVMADDGNGNLLLDGTDRLLPFNRIPVNCINEVGLIVKSDSAEWVSLESDVESVEYVAIGLRCDLDQDLLNAGVSHRTTEYEAHAARMLRKDSSGIADEMHRRDFIEVKEVGIQNDSTVDKPHIISVKGTKSLQRINEEILISPFLDFPMTENPFKQRARAYPIDFVWKKSKQYLCVLDIPAGFVVAEMPAPMQLEDELIKMDYSTELLGERLKLTGNVKFKESVYRATDYQLLKRHFDTMIQKFNEVVILKPE